MDPRLRHGIAAFNEGDFFAAHEFWEAVWLEAVGEERLVLQALIQIAAGYHKHAIGVPAGAHKLLARGCARLQQTAERIGDLDLSDFRSHVEADLARVTARQPVLSPPQL